MDNFKKPSKDAFKNALKNGAGDEIIKLMESIQSARNIEAAFPISANINSKENQHSTNPTNEILKNEHLQHFALGSILYAWDIKVIK